MDAFGEAGVPLRILRGETEETRSRELPRDGRYTFKLPSSNSIIFDAHMGSVSKAYKDENNAGRLVLYGNASEYYLSAEEAYMVLSEFHESFGISAADLDTWFEPIRNGELASSFYQATTQKSYPKITIEAANSFSEKAPIFLNLFISFDQKSFNRLGLSADTNDVKNLNFDVPKIIDSVRPKATGVEVSSTSSVEVPSVAKTIEESTAREPATEKPAEVDTPEPSEEPVEQSSNWWLWLIGAVVVVGGIGLIARRKS